MRELIVEGFDSFEKRVTICEVKSMCGGVSVAMSGEGPTDLDEGDSTLGFKIAKP